MKILLIGLLGLVAISSVKGLAKTAYDKLSPEEHSEFVKKMRVFKRRQQFKIKRKLRKRASKSKSKLDQAKIYSTWRGYSYTDSERDHDIKRFAQLKKPKSEKNSVKNNLKFHQETLKKYNNLKKIIKIHNVNYEYFYKSSLSYLDIGKIRKRTPYFIRYFLSGLTNWFDYYRILDFSNCSKDSKTCTILMPNPRYNAPNLYRMIYDEFGDLKKMRELQGGFSLIAWTLSKEDFSKSPIFKYIVSEENQGFYKEKENKKTILDLKGVDRAWLRNLKESILVHLKNIYAVTPDKDSIKMYYHYPVGHQNSLLHLHVRVNQAQHPLEASKSFSLEQVITRVDYDKNKKANSTFYYDRPSLPGKKIKSIELETWVMNMIKDRVSNKGIFIEPRFTAKRHVVARYPNPIHVAALPGISYTEIPNPFNKNSDSTISSFHNNRAHDLFNKWLKNNPTTTTQKFNLG